MIRTSFIAFLTILLQHMSLAQEGHTITGTIRDAASAVPKQALASLILAKDSSVISSVLPAADGSYRINASSVAGTLLRIEAPGYTTWYGQPATQAVQQLNAVLAKNNLLSEVTVTTRKPVYEQKADRTVFNVENSATATGTDAWGTLKKTPGVVVMNGQITVAGKGTAAVMINGRIQQVAGEDLAQLLRSIPSDNLSRIEVISTPPAKYDAEGNMGLINIVTKKNLKQGFRGSVTAAFKRNALNSPSASTTMSYGSEKLSLTLNANAGVYAYQYVNRTNSYFGGQKWEQVLVSGYASNSARLQLAADYKLNRKMTIGIIASEALNTLDFPDSMEARVYNGGSRPDSIIRTRGRSDDRFPGKHSLNLNYEWRFDEGGTKLNIDADYYSQKGNRLREFGLTSYYNDGETAAGESARITGNPSVIIRSVRADLELPLKFAKFTAGVKASAVDNVADNHHELANGGEYSTDLSRTNRFEYSEQIKAAYFTLQRKIGKLDVQAGLRAEHTRTEGYSPTLSRTDINDYTQLFPSGYLQYSPSGPHSFTLSYSRRINRPPYGYLNPFRLYFSANSFAEGNPYLRPSIRNGAELNYVLKGRYFFKAFFSQTDNYWDRIIETDPVNGTTSYTRANIGRGQWMGIGASATVSPRTWWEFRASINLDHNDFRLQHFGRKDHPGSTFPWTDMNHSFVLDRKKTLTAELYTYYYARRQKDYKIWEEMSVVNIGIRKTMLDNNLILALNLDDIFAKAYWYQTNIVNGTTEYSYDNEQGVRVAVTWKFGNKNIKGKRDKALMEEIQRAIQ